MDRIAQKLARWFGSAPFILFHMVWFASWIVLNLILSFDKDWSLLTIIVSLEAIFLSLFILRAENVASDKAEKQEKLDLHKSDEIIKMLDRRRKT